MLQESLLWGSKFVAAAKKLFFSKVFFAATTEIAVVIAELVAVMIRNGNALGILLYPLETHSGLCRRKSSPDETPRSPWRFWM